MNICVADTTANAVVIVDHAGQFRLNYSDFFSTTVYQKLIYLSQLESPQKVISTDWHTDAEYGTCIYISDQDGKFLRCIGLPYFHCPWGVYVDTKDNLFMAEYYTGKGKKIKYCL